MTGAGAPGAAGIIKCLLQEESIRLTVADADENAVGKYLHQPFITIPRGDDPNFTERLLSICKEQEVDVVLPLVTRELFPLAEAKERFAEEGMKVLVSSAEAIQIANDKGICYQFLKESGIAVPKFFVVRTTEEFIHAAFELRHPQESFSFKPCVSNGSRGFRIVSDSLNEAEQLFNHKPYNTRITYAHALKILSSQPFPPLVLTEYLPGEEWSVDCLANKGTTILAVLRTREKMINGISVQGRFLQDESIVRYCTQIIAQLNLHGNIGIQLKRANDGTPLLLEINPRVQGTIVAALGAGVNLPLLAVKQEMRLPVQPKELTVKWGTSFSRYWTEVFH